jgi:hypothetical protein
VDVHISTPSEIESNKCDFLSKQTNLLAFPPENENCPSSVNSVNCGNNYKNSDRTNNSTTEQNILLSCKETNFLSKQGLNFYILTYIISILNLMN